MEDEDFDTGRHVMAVLSLCYTKTHALGGLQYLRTKCLIVLALSQAMCSI